MQLRFVASSSTESDRPYPILQGNADDKKQPSGSYSEAKVEGKSKSEFKQSGNKHKTSMEASESTSASSNAVNVKSSSLEGEVVPRLSSSPLHQLMGYSSPSEIINESYVPQDFATGPEGLSNFQCPTALLIYLWVHNSIPLYIVVERILFI
ncbi:hypothetical protein NE237_022129 [Protea cynaroides]|uniref:Uncharacterized protein n=1 Tax=Protea cynaroides TaxID=273540 RepID=A0A9Q0HAD5_9MAGN|nr:hypothetical protein NE237_022129 [Protea cynaroides]